MFASRGRSPRSARVAGGWQLRPGVEAFEARRLCAADWTVMFYLTASNLEVESAAYVEGLEQEVARLPGTVNVALLYDQAGGEIPINDAHGQPAGTRSAIEFATGGGKQSPWGGTGRAIVRGDSDL